MSIRWIVWLAVNLLLILVCAAYGNVTTAFDQAGLQRTILAGVMGVCGFISVFTFPNVQAKRAWQLILGVSLLARLVLLPAAPSDDVNRYLWEGKLIELGVNPYLGTAEGDQYKEYRDQYWEGMNHRDRPTAYPPLALELFGIINQLGYHPMSYKVVSLILDLFLIATLLALLRHHHLPLRWVLLYALSPLPLLSFAAEGHFDIMMMLALTVAMLAFSKRKMAICGAAVAIAVGVKIMAAVVAPILLWRAGKRGWTVAAIVLVLPVMFYWQNIEFVFKALFLFGSGGAFNGPVYQILDELIFEEKVYVQVSIACMYALCWLVAFWLMLKKQLWSALFISFGALVILSPIVHFWYLSWILPIMVLRPKLSWISLSVTSSLYFLVWHSMGNGNDWALPLWAKWMFWVPFGALFIIENKHIVSRFRFMLRSGKIDSTSDFSIVIPTYNPGKNMQRAVNSIVIQSLQPRELIFADASSDDGSLDELEIDDVEVSTVTTELGRGAQIKAGVEAARGEWVIILHSDVVLPEGTLQGLAEVIEKNPFVIGGALGQRFTSESSGLFLIEAMNEFRAVLLQTSFGDQTQFFHRKTVIQEGVLTDQPLMEDVEMSDRLVALGDTLYVGHEAKVSAQKWIRGNFWKRFFTIIEFCLRYRLLGFTRKQRSQLSREFYNRYYRS